MAIEKIINIDVNTDSESLGTLKQQLKEAQREVEALSDKFGSTSKEAVNAARKAAELKDKIGDAKALTDAFNPDAKFNALTKSLSGVASGFAVVEGALGVLGVEGEEVQKTLLKVQSAMALSQGLQQLGEARDSFKQLGAVAINAFKGIKGAIAGTGIGLLLIAIGGIVAYWDDIKSAVSGVSAEQESLNQKVKANVELAKSNLDSVSKEENILRLKGVSEKQILQMKIQQVNAVMEATREQIKQAEITLKSQIESDKKNKQILKGVIEFLTIPLQLILKTVDKVASVLGKDLNLTDKINDWTASLIFDPKKTKEEGDKAISELRKQLKTLENDRAGFQISINDIEKKASEERIRIATEEYEKKKALQEKHKYDSGELYAFKQTEITDTINDEQFLYDELRKVDQAEQIKKDEEKALRNEINKANQKKLEDDQQAARDWKKQKDDEALANYRATQEMYYQAAYNTLSTISNLAQLFAGKSEKQQRRAFKIQKAVSIAQTAIDTYKGAQAAYQSMAGIPYVGPILGAVAAAAAVAAGLVNIKKISSQKFEGGGDTAGGGVSVPNLSASTPSLSSVVAPTLSGIGAGGQNQINQDTSPIKAYVVSGEMSSQQQLDRNRVQLATL